MSLARLFGCANRVHASCQTELTPPCSFYCVVNIRGDSLWACRNCIPGEIVFSAFENFQSTAAHLPEWQLKLQISGLTGFNLIRMQLKTLGQGFVVTDVHQSLAYLIPLQKPKAPHVVFCCSVDRLVGVEDVSDLVDNFERYASDYDPKTNWKMEPRRGSK